MSTRPTPAERPREMFLQIVFALFLGAVITVVIGVGVNTFYAEPSAPGSREAWTGSAMVSESYEYFGPDDFYMGMDGWSAPLDDLRREQNKLQRCERSKTCELTPEQEQRLSAIPDEMRTARAQLDAAKSAYQDAKNDWQRNTSMILIAFATLLLALSLVTMAWIWGMSAGLMFGGIFTMIYGVGVAVASGESTYRFLVLVVALAITLAVGYLRFGWRQRPQTEEGPEDAAPVAVPPGVAVEDTSSPGTE